MRNPRSQQIKKMSGVRSQRAVLNPYVMDDIAFTREELLRARGDDSSITR